MQRRFALSFSFALVAISFLTLGKAPRMPERSGGDVLAMAQRAAEGRLTTA